MSDRASVHSDDLLDPSESSPNDELTGFWLNETDDNTKHAVHCLLFARTEQETLLETETEDLTKLNAIVLMHMRFDGRIGFPGGMVDNSVVGLNNEEFYKELVEALRRELYEELGLNEIIRSRLTTKDYIFSSARPRRNGGTIILHFFSIELTESELVDIEQAAHHAKDYGLEVLGNIRVPLFTMNDGFRGLPAFLTNAFAGTAREQLLTGLERLGIMTKVELEKAVNASNQKKHSGPPLVE